jgi:hypothetical protein
MGGIGILRCLIEPSAFLGPSLFEEQSHVGILTFSPSSSAVKQLEKLRIADSVEAPMTNQGFVVGIDQSVLGALEWLGPSIEMSFLGGFQLRMHSQ